MWQCVTPNRFAAQYECGQASLPWVGRDCSTRVSDQLCLWPDTLLLSEARLLLFC